MTASQGHLEPWLLALHADSLADGIARLDDLIAECDKAFDALIRLRLDLDGVPDSAPLWKARTACLYALEIRDELQAARRRLGG
jgi:hypothetical protein